MLGEQVVLLLLGEGVLLGVLLGERVGQGELEGQGVLLEQREQQVHLPRRDHQGKELSKNNNSLRRFPLNVRAVSAKIKLPKKYFQHCHILRTDKKNLSLLLLPS